MRENRTKLVLSLLITKHRNDHYPSRLCIIVPGRRSGLSLVLTNYADKKDSMIPSSCFLVWQDFVEHPQQITFGTASIRDNGDQLLIVRKFIIEPQDARQRPITMQQLCYQSGIVARVSLITQKNMNIVNIEKNVVGRQTSLSFLYGKCWRRRTIIEVSSP